jgi:broad specificity phosphatase PhoE
MKIYAIRHGQTDLNSEGRIQGRKSDPSLNKLGRKQAREIAETLSSKGIDLIITSPMKRAMETAEIIAEHLKIGKDKIISGARLYERDFGDYEGKPMAEVDINSLRRWTDNAPIPNGETIRELASRIFGFLDDSLERFYDKKAILFVVHGHVLRTMYWYFNGLPKVSRILGRTFKGLPAVGEEVIETDNCGLYEFDTDKIPPGMKEYQIILDRRTLEERLSRIAKTPYTGNYNFCFAMCYIPGDFEISYNQYKCHTCGKETKYESSILYSLENSKGYVENINNTRLQIDAVVDEREYCSHCTGKGIDSPMPVFKIRFSPNEEYHEARTGDDEDYKCILAFFKGQDSYDNSQSDVTYPLNEQIDQLVKMTGLCPEIVMDWQAWYEELKKDRAFEVISMGVQRAVYGEDAKAIKKKQKQEEKLKKAEEAKKEAELAASIKENENSISYKNALEIVKRVPADIKLSEDMKDEISNICNAGELLSETKIDNIVKLILETDSYSKIITDKNQLDKSLREIAQEKNVTGKPLSQSELESLIMCYMPTGEEPEKNETEKPKEERNILTHAEIDNLLCYYMVSDEPVYEKESVISRIINKLKAFIPKGVVIREETYGKVLKKRDYTSDILTQEEIDELICQLIEYQEGEG